MNETHKILITKYRFEDSVTGIRLPIVVNLIIAVYFIIFDWQNPYLIYCLGSGIILLVITYFYDWKTPYLNLFIALVYLMVFIAEMIFEGFPNPSYYPSGSGKGVFIDLILFILPFVYIGIRLFTVIPLIRVFWLSYQLEKMKAHVNSF
jgi:hypothetical protein